MRVIREFFGKIRPYNGVKTATMLQMSATECGVVSLAVIFTYLGVYISIEKLRELCGTSRDGAKAATLINVAENLGFQASAYRVEIEDIKHLTRPVIAFWKFSHYLVIEGVGHGKVFINDPAFGRSSVSFDEFDQSFTGIIIEIKRGTAVAKVKRPAQFLSLLHQWLVHYRRELAFLVACMTLVAGVPLLSAKLSSVFVDYCLIGRNLNLIPGIVFTVLTSSIIYTMTLRSQKVSQFRLSTKSSIIKSSELMWHMLKLPLLFYSIRQKTEIAAVLMRAEAVANTIFKSLASILINSVMTLSSVILLFNIDGVLVTVLLFMSCLLLMATALLSKLSYSHEQASVHTLGKYYSLTLSGIKNIETIKTCGIESGTFNKWYQALCSKLQAQDKTNTLAILMESTFQLFNSVSMLATLCIGGMRVADGHLSVGNLMAFYALQLFFCGQVTALMAAGKDAQLSMVSEARIADIEKYKIDPRFLMEGKRFDCVSGPILSCRDVYFHYNQAAAPVLSNINLDIYAGQHIAFVGGTGSGKSTLIKLLSLLHYPSAGTVLLHGCPTKEMSASSITKTFAYVAQDASLFTGSIYDNLTSWRDDVPISIVHSAIETACLTDVVKARGLYGCVEEGGSNFSGGERQRIDIARALIQGASILVLDEATASLDVQTEELILRNLKQQSISLIFVAHRLSTIKHCDQIYVLEKGCLVEQGRHDELIHAQSSYFQLLQCEHKN